MFTVENPTYNPVNNSIPQLFAISIADSTSIKNNGKMADNDDDDELDGWEIFGIVAGSVAFVAIIVFIVWYCWKKKKQ